MPHQAKTPIDKPLSGKGLTERDSQRRRWSVTEVGPETDVETAACGEVTAAANFLRKMNDIVGQDGETSKRDKGAPAIAKQYDLRVLKTQLSPPV